MDRCHHTGLSDLLHTYSPIFVSFSTFSPSLMKEKQGFLLFVLRPRMSSYYYASLSVSAGRPDHRVKNKLRSGGIHQTMSFRLWRFLLSDMRKSFPSMSLQDSSVCTKDWDPATKLALLLYFFARSPPLAPFFPSSPFSRQFPHRLPSFCGRRNYQLEN